MNLERFFDKSDNANNHIIVFKLKERFSPDNKEKGKPGRKKGSKNFNDTDLLKLSEGNEVINNDILEDYLKKYPNSKLVKIGEDTSYIIEHVKGYIKVHRVITPKYRTNDNKIVQAPSKSIINHCYLSASYLAYLITTKYSLGIPVNRMKCFMDSQGLGYNVGDIYKWHMKSADLLEPIWKAMIDKMASDAFNVLNIDETRLRVIEECSNSREQCYTYLYCADNDNKHLRIFDYTGSRSSDNTKKYLSDFKGTVISDGFNGYNALESENIKLQSCTVHLRRYFTNITKVMSDEQRENSEAYKVVQLLDVLFDKEENSQKRDLLLMR